MSTWDDADALKAALDRYRPINREKMAIITEKLNLEWTYHSNAIEGNTLTLAETQFFLREGLTVEGKPLHDFVAARNHHQAIQYLQECLDRNINEALVREIHGLLLRGIDSITIGTGPDAFEKAIYPGTYKYDNNHVLLPDGSIHWYCDHLQVPGEMERLIQWYEQQRGHLHPIQLAAGFHHRLVAIHPFTDGNGRVSRLLMNLILMQHQYPPAVIRNEERRAYFAALRDADAGDLTPFAELVAEAVARTLRLMLDVVEGRIGLTPEDVRAKIERLSRAGVAPERTEQIQRAKEAGQQVNEHIRKTVQLLETRAEVAGQLQGIQTTFVHCATRPDEFAAFGRLRGIKLLDPVTFPTPCWGLTLSSRDPSMSRWEIWFETALTLTEILVMRASREHGKLHQDPFFLRFIRTPVSAPDRRDIEEFVLREVAAFVNRAEAALHDEEPQ